MSEDVVKHGGSRVGSGRKKSITTKKVYSLRLDKKLIQKLESIPKTEIEKKLLELVNSNNADTAAGNNC